MKHITLLLVLSITSCTSLYVKIPMAVIKAPSVITKDAKEVNLSAAPVKKFSTTNDASRRPPVLISDAANDTVIKGDFNFSVLDHLYYGAGVNSDFGLNMQAEYNFINTTSEIQQGWLANVYTVIYYDNTSRKGDQNGLLGPGGNNWKGNISLLGGYLGSSAGYRFNKYFMTYAGLAINNFSTKTEINQDVSSDGFNLGGQYKQQTAGNNRSLGLGFQFDMSMLHLRPGIMWTNFSADQINQDDFLASLTISAY